MVFGKKDQKRQMDITISSEKLEQIRKACLTTCDSCLGHILTEDVRCETEIKNRTGMTKHKFNTMYCDTKLIPL